MNFSHLLSFFFLIIKVPFGVLLHNANKLDEMAKILTRYMKLVPTVEAEGHRQLPNGSVLDFEDTRFFLFFLVGTNSLLHKFKGHRYTEILMTNLLTVLKDLFQLSKTGTQE